MKIGLLICDHLTSEHQDIDGDFADMFARLFGPYAPDIRLQSYDVIAGRYPESLYECDGFIITGSRSGVNDDAPWIPGLKAFVRQLHQARRPTVGICFGHQMLVAALGGEVRKSARDWGLGAHEATIHSAPSWMQPHLSSYNLLYLHQDQVESLPEDAQIIASTDHCPIAAITIGEHMLGIQAHPEFTTGFVDAVLTSLAGRIAEESIEAARGTLGQTTHEGVIAQWIQAFFARNGT